MVAERARVDALHPQKSARGEIRRRPKARQFAQDREARLRAFEADGEFIAVRPAADGEHLAANLPNARVAPLDDMCGVRQACAERIIIFARHRRRLAGRKTPISRRRRPRSGSSLSAQAARPANAHKSFVGTVKGELIHSPRRIARLSYRLSIEGASRAVDIFTVEVKAEWIAPGLKPPCTARLRWMKPPSPSDSIRYSSRLPCSRWNPSRPKNVSAASRSLQGRMAVSRCWMAATASPA